MFKKTRAKLRTAFNLFLKTFSDLAASIREQTTTNRTIEASVNLRHAELLAAIGQVSASTKFLEHATRKDRQQRGLKD